MKRLKSVTLTDQTKEKLLPIILWVGILLILVMIYELHPRILADIISFFSGLTLSEVPGTGISLPAPANPATHLNLYAAAFQFCLAFGFLEIGILGLRIFFHSTVPRKAETVENIVFWLGTSYLSITYLVRMTFASEWFVFWTGIILIFGLSLVARSFVIMARR